MLLLAQATPVAPCPASRADIFFMLQNFTGEDVCNDIKEKNGYAVCFDKIIV